MQRQARFGLALLVIPLVIVLLAVSAWAIDSASNSGQVPRNTVLLGDDIGGLSANATREQVAAASDELASRPVTITTDAGTLETTAGELGLTLDQDATVDAALHADEQDSSVLRPISWLMAFGDPYVVELQWQLDRTQLAAATAAVQAKNRVDAQEPNIRVTDSGFEVVPGVVGRNLDLDRLATDLEVAAARGTGPITVTTETVETAPSFPDTAAEEVAAEADRISGEPLTLTVGGETATVEPATLRSWLAATPNESGLTLTIDQARIEADLADLVGDVGTAPVDVRFTVNDDGSIGIVDGTPGTTCCAPDSVQRIVASLQAGERTVALELVEAPPPHDRAWAEGIGVNEPVATFTTNHPCCAARVQNIHRIADLLRGYVIPPGETLSINETIGKRTYDKGFVDAPVIYSGKMEKDVGGGVSQFATTLFNAAFYGGLDFGEYQSHSLYIERYPYGVEATLSYPHPDLQIKNTTPYGVMVWPTYTDTSITVTLYSTPWVKGEKGAQRKTPEGNCTRVTTDRLRTWTDGRQETDTVFAVYRPGEGISC